jgi:hypothetical protein
MKTFNDIIWKKHRIPGAIQGILKLKKGFELSVVAGEFHYSTPRENLGSPDLHSSFEVAIFDNEGKFVGDVLGWQSREDINTLLSNY